MKLIHNVDEYISNAPQEHQAKLRQMRELIRKAAPDAEEKISYAMPYYGYKGRLAYFQITKNHIGLYIPPPVVEEHAEELKHYITATSTVQFPLDQDLPAALITKLVIARVQKNNEKQTSKART